MRSRLMEERVLEAGRDKGDNYAELGGTSVTDGSGFLIATATLETLTNGCL